MKLQKLSKGKKKYILLCSLFLCIISIEVYPQVGDNYGTVVGPATPGVGQQFSDDGFKPPQTRKEEKARKKAIRYSLSFSELRILSLKEKGRSDELTFWQKLRYPCIKRKKRKAEKINKKAEAAQEKNNVKSNKSTGTKPGYMMGMQEYELTTEEETLLEKAQQDSAQLSRKEKRQIKKIRRKQKKLDKHKAQYTVEELTEDEKKLLTEAKNTPDALTKTQKKELKKIKKKQKKNDEAEDRVRTFRNDSVYASGGFVIGVPKQSFFKRMKKKLKYNRHTRPSKFVKRQRRIARKYTPTTKENEALNKGKGGLRLTRAEKRRAKRAATKLFLRKEKSKKLIKKEFVKNQTKSTQKMMKKRKNKTKDHYKKRQKKFKKINKNKK